MNIYSSFNTCMIYDDIVMLGINILYSELH